MNFITWSTAYSLFPNATFLDPRKQHELAACGPDSEAYVEKYEQRGWKVVKKTGPETSPLPLNQARCFSDANSWRIALNIDGVVPAVTPDFVVGLAHFDIEDYGVYNGRQVEFCMVFQDFDHPTLKYTYLRGRKTGILTSGISTYSTS